MRKVRLTELPAAFEAPPQAERVSHKFEFELITPMFGGDAESWKLDLKNPVRSQAVKGQLRFWWRTMQRKQDPVKLLAMENRIWGGKTVDAKGDETRIKSPVSLAVTAQRDISAEQAEMESKYAVRDNVMPKYVLFPITEKVKKDELIHFVTKLQFTLQLSCPQKLEQEILNTLKLWTLFGGVGARTRRGTGSLYCEELLSGFDSLDAVRNWIHSIAPAHPPLTYPTMGGALLAAKEENGQPEKIWHSMLDGYGKFRQDRTPGNPRPGRSYWPEPDAIRRISGQHSGAHPPVHPDGNWFPRALFGMPILTRFNQQNNGSGDPGPDFHLEPDIGTGERWPSPVIFKVIKLNNGKIYKLMLVMNQQLPERIKLKNSRVDHRLQANEMPDQWQDKQMKTNKPLNGQTPYQAAADFLNLGGLS